MNSSFSLPTYNQVFLIHTPEYLNSLFILILTAIPFNQITVIPHLNFSMLIGLPSQFLASQPLRKWIVNSGPGFATY